MAGRKRDPDTVFRISLHKTNGYSYAATQPYFIDEKTGKTRRHYVHWGTVSENLKFHPNNLYRNTPYEERIRLIFPAGWDISEADKINRKDQELLDEETLAAVSARYTSSIPTKHIFSGTNVLTEGDQSNYRLYGDIWLMLEIAGKTGVIADLQQTFGKDDPIVNDILTLAIFHCVSGQSYDHVSSWQKYVKTPSAQSLTDSYIIELCQKITDEHRKNFLKERMHRMEKENLTVCDSITESSWTGDLAGFHIGKNSDGRDMGCTVESVAYAKNSGEPLYYRSFAGNVSDTLASRTVIEELHELGILHHEVTFDRGLRTDEQIFGMYREGYSFIVCADVRQDPIYSQVKKIHFNAFGLPENMPLDVEYNLYYNQFRCQFRIGNAEDLPLNCSLFLNISQRQELLRKIRAVVVKEQEMLGKRFPAGRVSVTEDEIEKYNQELMYHRIMVDEKTRKISYVENSRLKKDRACAGFFALLSNKVQGDAILHLQNYSLREEQEKYFAVMKERRTFDVQSSSIERGRRGRLFILFVGLILLTRIRSVCKQELSPMYRGAEAILDEMRPIRYVEYANSTSMMTPFTKEQIEIASAFDIAPPKSCISMELIEDSEAKGRKSLGRRKKR